MKFVFDKKLGTYVPDYMISDEQAASEVQTAVFAWLDANPSIPKRNSFSTRSIAYEFFNAHPEFSGCLDEVRNACAMWFNANRKLAESAPESVEVGSSEVPATEEGAACGGVCPGGGAASTDGVAGGISPTVGEISALDIMSPVLKKEKKKKKSTEDFDGDDDVQNKDEIIASVPEENKHGDCYQQAWKTFYAHSSEGAVLCHGIVVGRGPIDGIKYNHAWVEVGDIVIDTTIELFKKGFPKTAYYGLGNVDEKLVFRYTAEDIARKVSEWGTYGPWEDILWRYP